MQGICRTYGADVRFVEEKDAILAKSSGALPAESQCRRRAAAIATACSGGAGVPGNSVCAVFRAVTLHIASLKSAILEAVVSAMNDLAASQAGEVDVPKCWVDTSGDAILFPVAPGSPEWSSVEQQFKSTLPTAQIVNLQRVQNIDMWRAYSVQKKNMLKRVRRLGPPRATPVCVCVAARQLGAGWEEKAEVRLFHGTSNAVPSEIYAGECGFDHRFCACGPCWWLFGIWLCVGTSGMWGRGIYFAVNAVCAAQRQCTQPT